MIFEKNREEAFANCFPEVDLEENDFSKFGYMQVAVSIFDHWLDVLEAEKSKIITYSIALQEERLKEYIEGENRFLKLYTELGAGGVVINRKGPPYQLEACSQKFRNILINSLREKRLMDVYFLEMRLRIIGGYDRTDLLLLEDWKTFPLLEKKIQESGLHILQNQESGS